MADLSDIGDLEPVHKVAGAEFLEVDGAVDIDRIAREMEIETQHYHEAYARVLLRLRQESEWESDVKQWMEVAQPAVVMALGALIRHAGVSAPQRLVDRGYDVAQQVLARLEKLIERD